MKTKIIYISGGEVFPPAQVRGAFDAVRSMLNLDSDTIIFGVPVDSDDVCAGISPEITMVAAEIAKEEQMEENLISKAPEIAEKPKRTRKKKEADAAVSDTENKPVTPILSIIGAVNPETAPSQEIVEEESIIIMESESEIAMESDAAGVQSLSDSIDDDEIKSIEDIFADIAPLSEDRPVDLTEYGHAEDADEAHVAESSETDAEIDETLSKLATEFVATHPSPQSGAEALGTKGGRIGKLKNILPFKKKEKTESSVLGDLFGWAGVAANDDAAEFAMPEFFRMSN
jgi:hypothetical protein